MATIKNLKLDEITLEYNSFVDSQVLTAKQLNDIVDFFEDQQRLTRTCLIGVGRVCGLSIKGDANGITVSKGCGITTDGDLLYLPEITYKHFRAYDNSLIKYPPFYPLGTDAAQMTLWELLPETSAPQPGDSKPLAQFAATSTRQLADMVALLYLEYFEKEPDACTAIDCDNQGKKQVAKPKVLLLTRADMDQIIVRTNAEIVADDLFKRYFDAYTAYFELPVLGAKRVFLDPPSTPSPEVLATAYTTAAASGAQALATAIDKAYQTFRFVLDPDARYNLSALRNTLTATFGQSVPPVQAQYVYDFYKDLVTAYNELRAVLSDLIYQCCPDLYSFPKHLMLGALNAVPAVLPTPYRHVFYPSPIVSRQKEQLHQARTMLDRLVLLINGYQVPANSTDIRITPSRDYNRPLEKRAIPFYYQNVPSLIAKWNYGRTQQGTEKHILSYHGPAYAPDNELVTHPLHYSIDGNDFFRIEGHLGRTYAEVLKSIDSLRKQYNLPFDLVAVRLGDAQLADVNLGDYRCQFDDLETVLRAWLAEQWCLFSAVTQFFSSFDTRTGTRTENPLRDRVVEESIDTGGVRYVTRMAMAGPPSAEATPFSQPGPSPLDYGGASIDVVDVNLDKNPFFIGNLFDHAVKNTRITGIADLAEAVINQVDTSVLGTDDVDVVVSIPVRILAAVRKLCEWTPDRLIDIDETMIENYRANLKVLCNEVKKARKKTQTIFKKQAYVARGYETDYELILWQLSENCCADEKLDVFQTEIKKRKEAILQQLTFAHYAASHTGLEHKAGVPAGGTFVLLYSSTTVIADFCLPYICCSDCPPVAFIIPDQKVSLTLPKAAVCSDEPLLPFRATPADGTVKAAKGFAATVVQQDNAYFFDPSKVKEGQFGQPIAFTLNDQATDCAILVIKHPEIKPSATPQLGEQELSVHLDAATNQQDTDSFTYTWTLGDGRIHAGLSSPKLDVTYVVADLRKNFPEGKLTLTLTATNQHCTNTQPLELAVDIPAEQPELKLAAEVVCSDAGPVPFTTVKPENGFVSAKSAPEAVKNVNGQWVFDPAAGPFDQPINDFTVNGQHIPGCVITVFEHPAPAFTYKMETNKEKQTVTIRLENTTPHADSFTFLWDLDKESRSEAVNPTMVVEMANFPRGRTVSIRLAATNKRHPECRETTARLIELPGSRQVINKGDLLNLRDVLITPVKKDPNDGR